MGDVGARIERGLRARPALTLGVGLAIGQAAALEIAGAGWHALDAVALAACATVAALAASFGRRTATWLALATLAVACGRALDAGAPTGGRGAVAGRSAQLEQPVAGTLRVDGRRSRLVSEPHHPWLLQFEGPPPADGSAVAILPPGELRQFARGPVPGPEARRGQVLGIHRVAVDELVRLGEPRDASGSGLTNSFGTVRTHLVDRCRRLGLTGERGLAPALLVGDRGDLDRSTADLFTRTGTRHLLALSGLHVGLLAAVVLQPIGAAASLVARLAGASPARMMLLADLARSLWLVGFALVAGAAPPVVRAALALGAMLLARHLPGPAGAPWRGRQRDSLSIWGAALSLECLADATAIASLSVSLSYGATLGILLVAGRLARGMRSQAGIDRRRGQVLRWHRPRPVLAASILVERSAHSLRTGLACSVAAVAATMPIAIATFGELAPIGIVATLAAVPIVALLLPLLWFAVVSEIGTAVRWVQQLEHGLVRLLTWFDGFAATPWLAPDRPDWLPWCATAAAAVGFVGSSRRLRLSGLALAAACVAALAIPLRPQPAGLELVALDVGHGTCVALRAPGTGAWLFDAGSRDRPRLVAEALAPLMRRWEVQTVDLCLSHSDWDHRSASGWVATRLEPRRHLGWRDGDVSPPSHRPLHVDLAGVPAGRTFIDGGDGLRLTLLRGAPGDGNEGSRSLLVEWRGRRVLLSGDAVDGGLASVLAAGHLEGPLDLLLLPHHGSHGTAVTELLDRVAPEEVWVSCSGRPAIADELDRRGERWRSTGSEGPLTVIFEPSANRSENPSREAD